MSGDDRIIPISDSDFREWQRYMANNVNVPKPVLNGTGTVKPANAVGRFLLDTLDYLGVPSGRPRAAHKVLIAARIKALMQTAAGEAEQRQAAAEILEATGHNPDDHIATHWFLSRLGTCIAEIEQYGMEHAKHCKPVIQNERIVIP
jgi:hypothetical protein